MPDVLRAISEHRMPASRPLRTATQQFHALSVPLLLIKSVDTSVRHRTNESKSPQSRERAAQRMPHEANELVVEIAQSQILEIGVNGLRVKRMDCIRIICQFPRLDMASGGVIDQTQITQQLDNY